jgi:hypothetical protein
LVLLVVIVVGCDSGDARTTARVDSRSDHSVCITPEDPGQTDLTGCFPYQTSDVARLSAGSCVSVVVPAAVAEPIRNVKSLGRDCHVGRAVGFTRGDIVLIAVLATAAVGATAALLYFVVRGRRLRARS